MGPIKNAGANVGAGAAAAATAKGDQALTLAEQKLAMDFLYSLGGGPRSEPKTVSHRLFDDGANKVAVNEARLLAAITQTLKTQGLELVGGALSSKPFSELTPVRYMDSKPRERLTGLEVTLTVQRVKDSPATRVKPVATTEEKFRWSTQPPPISAYAPGGTVPGRKS